MEMTDDAGEVRAIRPSDLKHARQFDQLPGSLQAKLRTRGSQKALTKEQISIRLSREVLEGFRALGEGWQTQMDVALQEWLKAHRPA